MPELLTDLAGEIMEYARARDLTVCTAESCSAGRLAQELAKTEGASKHFMGGVVAYTKDADDPRSITCNWLPSRHEYSQHQPVQAENWR